MVKFRIKNRKIHMARHFLHIMYTKEPCYVVLLLENVKKYQCEVIATIQQWRRFSIGGQITEYKTLCVCWFIVYDFCFDCRCSRLPTTVSMERIHLAMRQFVVDCFGCRYSIKPRRPRMHYMYYPMSVHYYEPIDKYGIWLLPMNDSESITKTEKNTKCSRVWWIFSHDQNISDDIVLFVFVIIYFKHFGLTLRRLCTAVNWSEVM